MLLLLLLLVLLAFDSLLRSSKLQYSYILFVYCVAATQEHSVVSTAKTESTTMCY
jgi:hypothetical protein